jgi:hypothetical protein
MVWHLGQLRLPQEWNENTSVLHASQRQTWPPSAAVRQLRMSSMARRCDGGIDAPCAER